MTKSFISAAIILATSSIASAAVFQISGNPSCSPNSCVKVNNIDQQAVRQSGKTYFMTYRPNSIGHSDQTPNFVCWSAGHGSAVAVETYDAASGFNSAIAVEAFSRTELTVNGLALVLAQGNPGGALKIKSITCDK